MSQLIHCSSIGKHAIQRDDECRIVIIDTRTLRFTPTEYRLLLPLLGGQAVSDTELIREVFSQREDIQLRKVTDKHIDNIRSKLAPVGISVHRIAKYGYMLLAALT